MSTCGWWTSGTFREARGAVHRRAIRLSRLHARPASRIASRLLPVSAVTLASRFTRPEVADVRQGQMPASRSSASAGRLAQSGG